VRGGKKIFGNKAVLFGANGWEKFFFVENVCFIRPTARYEDSFLPSKVRSSVDEDSFLPKRFVHPWMEAVFYLSGDASQAKI
jgi:hypothetical protein